MLRYPVCTFRFFQPKFFCSEKVTKPTPLIVKLMSEFDDISVINRALRNKELSSIHFDEWKSRINILQKHFFSDGECFKMISIYPYLLRIPVGEFENSVKQWSLADLKLNQFQHLLLTQPKLIDVNVKTIRKRVSQLRVYVNSSETLCKLLIACPNIMFDDWEAVIEKLEYIVKIRKYSVGQIVESQALSKPLHFIKFRFELLEKCGIYKQDNTPVHKYNRFDKTKHINPTLKEILNPNGSDFAKIAKISHEEYAMCKSWHLENEDYEDESDDEGTGYHYN